MTQNGRRYPTGPSTPSPSPFSTFDWKTYRGSTPGDAIIVPTMRQLLSDIWNHPANRNARLQALGRAIHWQFHQRVLQRSVEILFHGLKLRCPPGNHSGSRAIYFSGLPDYPEMRFMQHYLRPGDRFIDAGANLGLYTFLALSIVGAGGFVGAFEPNANMASRLLENLRRNNIGNAKVHTLALSDHDGHARFDPTQDDCLGHVVAADASERGGEVPARRLDTLLTDVPYAMAKFDIEGYEPQAIRGAGRWLEQHNPPVMLVEMGGFSNRHGITTAAFVDDLASRGYHCASYDLDERRLIPTPRPWETRGDNVIVYAGRKRDEIEARLAPVS